MKFKDFKRGDVLSIDDQTYEIILIDLDAEESGVKYYIFYLHKLFSSSEARHELRYYVDTKEIIFLDNDKRKKIKPEEIHLEVFESAIKEKKGKKRKTKK